MALDATKLAEAIAGALGQQTDGEGNPLGTSPEGEAYARGLVKSMQSAIVTFLPNTINGTTAPGQPLSGGTGSGGTMVIQPGPMIAETSANLPGPNAAAEHSAIVQYVSTALVSFGPGNITGTCTNTPSSPGPLVAGAGSKGQLVGLNGAGAAAAVLAALGSTGPDALPVYTAMMDYISANAEVTFATGTIVGVCPSGGGPLTAGAGTGGTIS